VAGQIAEEVTHHLGAALGPGFPQAVSTTLSVAFFGSQMWARYFPFDEVAGQLEDAVNLILGASVT
jgi:TetR/AcrR family transcriptional regulator, cholesterol catabolism regulator